VLETLESTSISTLYLATSENSAWLATGRAKKVTPRKNFISLKL